MFIAKCAHQSQLSQVNRKWVPKLHGWRLSTTAPESHSHRSCGSQYHSEAASHVQGAAT